MVENTKTNTHTDIIIAVKTKEFLGRFGEIVVIDYDPDHHSSETGTNRAK